MSRKEVLVVTVGASLDAPTQAHKEYSLEELQTIRDYVCNSLHTGVLVLDARFAIEVKQLPEVEGERVEVKTREKQKAKTEEKPFTEREQKQRILQRLTDYRDKNGLGCLSAVSKKACRKGITEDTLRMLLAGQATLTLQDWLAIDKALDKLEADGP